jgi:CubicO group peptidase (beta-lactamase class C family)
MSTIPPVLETGLAAFMRGRMVPGLVAGLVREGRADSWGFGRTARDTERPPDADTVFEIGSITKVFTSTLLALLAEDGRLRLDQPIQSLLEKKVALTPEAQAVTLLHLATHTATFPRASRRMMGRGLRHPSNPYRDYTLKDLYDDLAQFRPGPGLGRAFTYSNLGAGLLGHLLELATGQTYEALVRLRVGPPLGLVDTTITLEDAQRARLAQGHWFGKPVGLWDLPALAGAGALRSTMRDLLKFLEAHLGLRETPLASALAAAGEPRVEVSPTLSIGLAWHLTPLAGAGSPPIVWHRGETGGMRGFVGFVRERGLGLALLANASVGVDELGLELIPRLS